MRHGTRISSLAAFGLLFCLTAGSAGGNETTSQAPPAPEMPPDWTIISDLSVPVDRVESIAQKLGVTISSLRNTFYDVEGQRVQLNVIITPDRANADKLMAKLKTMKSELALVQKDLIVYEFVGQNDVLPVIAEGRKHLESR